MNSKVLKLFVAAVWLVLWGSVGLAQGPSNQPSSYTIIDLGIAGDVSIAAGVNNEGLVSGSVYAPPNYNEQAFLWPATGLGTFGGQNSALLGATSGFSEISNPDPLGQDFCENGTHLICLALASPFKTPLPTLGGYNAVAYGNNNHGQVVGTSQTSTPDPTCPAGPPFFQIQQSVPALWQGGRVQELPTFPGDPHGHAYAISDSGQAVGSSGQCHLGAHALLWQKGTVTDLGNLGGVLYSEAYSINNLGQITGGSDLQGDLTSHAFLWRNGVMTDLGTLPGDYSSYGSAINNQGQVVGVSCDLNGNCRPFVWENGTMTDLNTLALPPGSPLYLIAPTWINDRGLIVGYAYDQNTGDVPAFLAVPSPNGRVSEATFPKVTLPDNVRKLVQQRLKKGRLKVGLGIPQ